MDRRSFFRRLLGTAAAITVASAVECFGVVEKISVFGKRFRSESISFMDASFAREAKRMEEAFKDNWEDRSSFSYLMDKQPMPDGAGFNYKEI